MRQRRRSAIAAFAGLAASLGCQGTLGLNLGGRQPQPLITRGPAQSPQGPARPPEPHHGASPGTATASAPPRPTPRRAYDPCDADYQKNRDFCVAWHMAEDAYFRGDWALVVQAGDKAKAAGPGLPELDTYLAAARKALASGDTGLYRHGVRGCPARISLDNPNAAYQALRCPTAQLTGTRADPVAWMRVELRKYLNDETHPLETTRAVFTHLCAVDLKAEEDAKDKTYPSRGLACAVQADRLSWPRLGPELANQPERDAMVARLRADVAYIKQRADSLFPRGSRDRAIFYDLPVRIAQEHAAWTQQNAAPLAAIAAFGRALRAGNVAGCEQALSKPLAVALAGVVADETSVKRALSEGSRYQLAEALARCHHYADRTAQASALIRALDGVPSRSTEAEKVYFAQRAELEEDDRKAEKLPHLRGKQLASIRAGDLSAPEFFIDDADQAWAHASARMGSGNVTGGTVRAVERIAGGKFKLVFARTRQQAAVQDCHKTGRIERIRPTGEVDYETECRTLRYETVWTEEGPFVVPDADRVRPGNYVTVLAVDDQHVVYAVAGKQGGRLIRLADLKFSP